MSPLASRIMVDAGRARLAAEAAKANGRDPISSIAPFVSYAMRIYGLSSDAIATELGVKEADVWNARARMDAHRRRP